MPSAVRPMRTSSQRVSAGEYDDAEQGRSLLQRARAGDANAFESLYHAYAPRVYGLAVRLCGERAAAAEITQDTFVLVWQRLHTFREQSDIGSWIHRIAVNCALETFRRDARRSSRVTLTDAPEQLEHATRPVLLDDRMDLQRALAQLSPLARTAFVLREIEGYSYAELSEWLSLSEVALRANVFRARHTLARLLER